MLVLTRKRSEMIQIGDDILVKVIHTSKGSVKIGIEAPNNVRVLRAELCGVPAVKHPAADRQNVEHELAFACSDQFPHVA